MGFDPAAYRPVCSRIRGPRTIPEADARGIRLRTSEFFRADVERLTDTEPSVVARDVPGTIES